MKTSPIAVLLLAGASPLLAALSSGYTLIPVGSSTTLVDASGTTVKSWTSGGYTAYLTRTGTLVGQTGSGTAAAAGYGSLIEKTDASQGSTTANQWTVSGFHHGHWVMPNGHWLGTVGVKINPKTALAAAGYTGSLTSIWDERIQEWDPVSKTVVWEWKASDHTLGTNHPRKFNSNTLFKSSDPLHVNSVVYDSARDLVVMSSHYLNEVLVIDHSTTTAEAATSSGGRYGKGGDLLFRWGAPVNYGGTTTAYSNVVHGGGVIQGGLPGAGNFTLFGNSDNSVKHSRWYEVKGQESDTGFVIGANGEFVSTLVFDWYSTTGTYESSGHYGYGQRLANGNTFLTFSGSSILVEVDPAKNILGTIKTSGNCIRSIRYETGHPALAALGLATTVSVSRPASSNLEPRVVGGRLIASGLEAGARIRVLDAQGAVRFQGAAQEGRLDVSTAGWSNGAYVLQASTGATSSSHLFTLAR